MRPRQTAFEAIAPVVKGSVGVALAALALAACSESKVEGGTGDTLIDDTRPEPRPPANPEAPMDAASIDAPIYDAQGGYAPLAACSTCACTPDTHYCFGGGTPRGLAPNASADASADADAAGDGALAACPLPASASVMQIGCNSIPAACAASPTCACLLEALQPQIRCYLVCREPGADFLVYCPSP